MPEFAFFLAALLVVAVTTGALLDRWKVRRGGRAFVWVTLFLLLPFSFVLFLVLMGLQWRSC